MMMMAQFYPENLWPPASVPRYLLLLVNPFSLYYIASEETNPSQNSLYKMFLVIKISNHN